MLLWFIEEQGYNIIIIPIIYIYIYIIYIYIYIYIYITINKTVELSNIYIYI